MDADLLEAGVSIVIPVYNSQATLGELVARLEIALFGLVDEHEIVLVDDGSTDESWREVERLGREVASIRGIRLLTNFGQHNALLCGVRHARYDKIVTLDDDLQHPPETIGTLLNALEPGTDVVYGVPQTLQHGWWRNSLSRSLKWAMAKVSGNPHIGSISAFRAFRTKLRKAFAEHAYSRLSLDLLISWGTRRVRAVAVRHDPRKVGRSNYRFLKLVDLTMVTLTAATTRPLRLASIMGFAFTLMGIGTLLYVLVQFLRFGSVPGFPFLASIIALFCGAQMFTLGIFGEYLARIYDHSQHRPTYVIDTTTGNRGEEAHTSPQAGAESTSTSMAGH